MVVHRRPLPLSAMRRWVARDGLASLRPARAFAALPPAPPVSVPAAPPAIDQLQPHWFTGSPRDIAALNSEVIAEAEKTPRMMELGGAETYRAMRHASFEHGDSERILDVTFDRRGFSGNEDGQTEARFFFPEPRERSSPRGALLHIHGGGFTVGSARGQNDERLLRHAANCNMSVLSVEYRLSPEHQHPAALQDCLAAAVYLDSAAGRTAARICESAPLLLVGESAGGTLAASLLVKLRDANSTEFAAAALTYGWYDMSETPFFKAWGEKRLVETADELRWFRSNYLGADFPDECLRDPDISPLYADLHGLPPALFSVGTEDALLEDSMFMYMRWLANGNPAQLRIYPGAAHGMGHFGPHQHTAQGEQVLRTLETFYAAHLPKSD